MVKNPYFQFPLCALSFGHSVDERLNAIISYGFIQAGYKLFQKLSPVERKRFLDDRLGNKPELNGIRRDEWSHCGALYGAYAIGITTNNLKATLKRHASLQAFADAFADRHGRDSIVRIKKWWVFKTRDNKGISYREFAVLCGIYSVIGDKEMAVVTRDRIRRCALGYRSAAIMQAELATRADKAQQLTERQLRDTLERLHRNNFFARATYGRRVTYYSIRLDGEEMRKKIQQRRTYRDFHRTTQAVQDQAMTDSIRQTLRDLGRRGPRFLAADPAV
jgi:hypothetical protein